jgi:hypothetical protein
VAQARRRQALGVNDQQAHSIERQLGTQQGARYLGWYNLSQRQATRERGKSTQQKVSI